MGAHHIWRNLGVAGAALVAACGTTQTVPDAAGPCPTANVSTQGWERVDAGPFSLRVPPGFSAEDVQPIDSRAGTYRNASGTVRVAYDYGWYSNDLSPDPVRLTERTRCTDSIGGKPVTIVVGDRVQPSEAGHHVVAGAWRDVDDGDPPVHLTVTGTAHDATELDVLLAILNSVEFQ